MERLVLFLQLRFDGLELRTQFLLSLLTDLLLKVEFIRNSFIEKLGAFS